MSELCASVCLRLEANMNLAASYYVSIVDAFGLACALLRTSSPACLLHCLVNEAGPNQGATGKIRGRRAHYYSLSYSQICSVIPFVLSFVIP